MRILMILMAAAACIVAVLLFYRRNRLNMEMKNDELSANERLKDEIRRSDFDDEAYRRHEAVKLQRISGLRREDESVADTVISYMSERFFPFPVFNIIITENSFILLENKMLICPILSIVSSTVF